MTADIDAPAKRGCVFCGETPLSREHVFGRWASRYWFGEDPTGATIDPTHVAPFRQIGGEPTTEGGFQPVVKAVFPERPAVKPAHMTVKAVCKGCNNGWMSTLEATVQPLVIRLLNERKVQFTRSEIRHLIRWCQKTTAILDYWNPQMSVLRSDVYAALHAGEPVPGTWDIRLARVDEEVEFAFNHVPLVTGEMQEDDSERTAHAAFPQQHVIGVQSMYALGDLAFLVRYSAHQFRGDTAIDADYYQVWSPPATLLGREARRIFKPRAFPLYYKSDWETWALWSVSKKRGVVPGVGVDKDGTTWVDDISITLGKDAVTVIGRDSTPYDVEALMAQEPRWVK